jgi:hypothetical protein
MVCPFGWFAAEGAAHEYKIGLLHESFKLID